MEQASDKPEPKRDDDRGCLLQIATLVATFIIMGFVPATAYSLNYSLLTKIIITAAQLIAIIVFFANYPKGRLRFWTACLYCLISLFLLFMALWNVGALWAHH